MMKEFVQQNCNNKEKKHFINLQLQTLLKISQRQ
jgi:hypothetical protein